MPANLAATLTQNLRSQYQRRLDKNENRPSIYGAMNLFKGQTAASDGIFDPETLANIAKSFGNTVDVPVIDNEVITIGNTRTCNFQTGGPTSALITLTFITYSFGFDMFPAQHFNNDAKYEQLFSRALENRLLKLAETIDAQCVATLEADKNQFWPAEILNYYAQVADALQVPQAEKEDFYNQFASVMNTMDYPGAPDVATNFQNLSLVRRLAAQGEGNAVNEGFQLMGYTWFPTNRIVSAALKESTVYGVMPGSVAMVPRVDPDSLMNHEAAGKEWSTVRVPILDMDMGVYYNPDCADGSAIQGGSGVTGLTRTKRESFEYSMDMVYQTVYNSDIVNRFSPIVKAEILL